ncbi:MAG: hypothetical protein ACOYYF_16130 [Chloroflexota bacterium]|nr:hypothetical protein [Chloroflexota bacterium]MBI5704592.1 hypothetical protein [Chloroflexota bacterium]
MFKRIILLAGAILGVVVVFRLADLFGSPALWVIGFVTVSALIRYGSLILTGSNSLRIISYFKRRPAVRLELINNILARKQTKVTDLRTEEVAALLIISLAKESVDITHMRAAEFPEEIFSDDFLDILYRYYMTSVLLV